MVGICRLTFIHCQGNGRSWLIRLELSSCNLMSTTLVLFTSQDNASSILSFCYCNFIIFPLHKGFVVAQIFRSGPLDCQMTGRTSLYMQLFILDISFHQRFKRIIIVLVLVKAGSVQLCPDNGHILSQNVLQLY